MAALSFLSIEVLSARISTNEIAAQSTSCLSSRNARWVRYNATNEIAHPVPSATASAVCVEIDSIPKELKALFAQENSLFSLF